MGSPRKYAHKPRGPVPYPHANFQLDTLKHYEMHSRTYIYIHTHTHPYTPRLHYFSSIDCKPLLGQWNFNIGLILGQDCNVVYVETKVQISSMKQTLQRFFQKSYWTWTYMFDFRATCCLFNHVDWIVEKTHSDTGRVQPVNRHNCILNVDLHHRSGTSFHIDISTGWKTAPLSKCEVCLFVWLFVCLFFS